MKPKFKKLTIYVDETIPVSRATQLIHRATGEGFLKEGNYWARIRDNEKRYYIDKYMNKSGSHTIWIGEEK